MKYFFGIIAFSFVAITTPIHAQSNGFVQLEDTGDSIIYTRPEGFRSINQRQGIVEFKTVSKYKNATSSTGSQYFEFVYRAWCSTGNLELQVTTVYDANKQRIYSSLEKEISTPTDSSANGRARDMACKQFGY
jgi:hypothetical protein